MSGFLISLARTPYFDAYFFATIWGLFTAVCAATAATVVYRNFDNWMGWNEVETQETQKPDCSFTLVVSAFN